LKYKWDGMRPKLLLNPVVELCFADTTKYSGRFHQVEFRQY
jgi:hypothetical protein